MRQARGSWWVVLLAGALVGLTGCMSAAKQGLHEVLGARAEVIPLSEGEGRHLARYNTVAYGQARTDLGSRVVSPSLLADYDAAAREAEAALAEKLPGGAPVLLVDSEILFYQKKGLLGAGQLLSRVRLRDGGEVVYEALVNATTKSFREGAAADLAEATVKSLAKFIRDRHEPEKE